MSVIPNRRGKPSFLPDLTANSRVKRTRRQLALEKLEERVVLSYVFTYDPTTNVATATSDGSSGDTLAFEKDASGNLEYSVNGSGFSNQWTNTVTSMPQTVPDGTPVDIVEASGGTDEAIQIGQPGTGHQASLMTSTFDISGGITSGSVTIDDSAGTVQAVGANQYQYDGTTFTGPNGLTVSIPVFQTQGVTIDGSDQDNTFAALGSAPTEPLNVVAGSGTNIVNVGSADTLANLNSVLTVTDPTGQTTLNVNDTADTSSSTATIDAASGNGAAPYEITGLSPAAIDYAGVTGGDGVTAVNVNGGPGSTPGITYDVYDTSANSTTTVTDGTGPDIVNVGNPAATLGLGVVNGAVVVNGGGNTAITVDDSGYTGPAVSAYTITGTTVSANFDFGGVTYSGATALTLDTETADGATVDVTTTANGVPTTVNDNSTGSTVNVSGTGTGSTLTVVTTATGTGSTVNVTNDSEPVDLTLNNTDTVNIGAAGGAGTVAGITSTVAITDTPSFFTLNVNDQGDATGQTWGVHSHTSTANVVVSGTELVRYDPVDLGALTVNAGTGGNTFYVQGTAAGVTTTINAGLTGTNRVNVYSTGDGSTLAIDAQGGANNSVTLGGRPNVGMQDLANTGSVINVADTTGSDNVTLDDSEDSTAQTATLIDSGTTATVTGLLPATINIADLGLAGLTINGGSGGNTFTVDGTPANAPTTINTGTGSDTTNVQATTGLAPLTINGQDGSDTVNIGDFGSLQGIKGPIGIDNVFDYTAINFDGSADTNAHDITLSADATDTTGTFTGLTPAPVNYTIGDVSSIGVTLGDAGTGSNNLTIDFSNGNPIQFSNGASPSLSYNAGSGAANTLNLQGDLPAADGGPGFLDETQDADGPGDGDFSFTDNLGNDSTLDYSGLSVDPVNDTANATNYTFNDFASDDATFNAVAGPTVLGFNTIQFNSNGALPAGEFTTTNISNKTKVTFNAEGFIGLDGTVNIPTAWTTGANPLTTLTFDLPETFQNYVSFDAVPSGVSTSYLGSTGADTTNVTGKGIPTGTTLSANGGAGINTLNYDAGGLVPTVTAGANPNEVLITLPGYGTLDATNYQTINITDVGPLTVTPTTNAISTVEGFNYVNAPVGSFATTIPTIFPAGTTTTGAPASDFTATVDWGDPTPDLTGGTITQDATNPNNYFVAGSHEYTENGAYTDTLSVSYAGGAVTGVVNGSTVSVSFPASTAAVTSSSAVTVTQGTLAVTALPIVGTEGTAIASAPIATFIDAGGAQPVADYTATISIVNSAGTVVATGAGTITQLGNSAEYSVTAPTLTLPNEGTYQVLVAVTDSGGATPLTVTGASTAVIADAPLTAGPPVAIAVNTGVPLPATTVAGSFTDGDTSAPASDFTAVIDWGDGSPTSLGTIVSTGGGGFEVEGAHQYAKPGTYATTVVVTDVGGSTVTLTGTATVTDLPLTATVHNFTAVQGQSSGNVVLATILDPNTSATVADISAMLTSWGDGTPASAVPLTVTEIGGSSAGVLFSISGSHTYATAGTFSATYTVTTLGGATTTPSPLVSTATVVPAAVTASGSTITGVEGNSTGSQVIATFTDADPASTVSDFTTGAGSVVVNWGDGTAPVTLPAADITSSGAANGVIFTVSAAHTYAEEGTYPITVTVTSNGGSATATTGAVAIAHGSAVIADAPLTASVTQPTVLPSEGVPFSGAVGTFTDGNPTAPATDYTYVSIDWGDGTPSSAGTVTQPGGVGTPFTVVGSHTYATAGTFPITVQVHDVGGSTVTIANTAIVAAATNTSTITTLLGQTGYLNPASDTGLSNGVANVTSDTTPNFYGSVTTTSMVPQTIILTATDTATGVATVIGRATTDASGDWNITSVALPQGTYNVTGQVTDSMGNVLSGSATTIVSHLVIDTTGPKVENVAFDRAIGTVYVTYEDPTLPDGTVGSGVSTASITDAANYSLTRPNAPADKFIVTSITPVATGVAGQQEVAVTFNNGALIKGGFNFNFTAFANSAGHPGGVQDVAENGMQGTFYGTFPSGNGVNGTNYNARLVAFHDQVLPPATTVGTVAPTTAASAAAARRAARLAKLVAHHDAALSHVNVKHVVRHK